jgi:hypothetical protein
MPNKDGLQTIEELRRGWPGHRWVRSAAAAPAGGGTCCRPPRPSWRSSKGSSAPPSGTRTEGRGYASRPVSCWGQPFPLRLSGARRRPTPGVRRSGRGAPPSAPAAAGRLSPPVGGTIRPGCV